MTDSANKRSRADDEQWTAARARVVLAACAKSGLSMRAFAIREGLAPRRLYRWSKRLAIVAADPVIARRSRASMDTRAPRLVPFVIKGSLADRAQIVIRHGGSTLEIDSASGVSPAWVAAVMVELERATCS